MTKTIEEQIRDARAEVTALREMRTYTDSEMQSECDHPVVRAYVRLTDRAASRLATLEAVRDGRMIPVFATVSVTYDEGWIAHGICGVEPCDSTVTRHLEHGAGDSLSVLRGYAHVPSTQVHEVEADSEVPS